MGEHVLATFLTRLNDVGDRLMKHISAKFTSEKGYSALFKAGVLLVGAALIALSQSGTFLYDKDLSAHKAKFAVESTTGKPLSETNCELLTSPLNSECLLAQHEIKTLSSSLKLFSRVVNVSLWFGICCVLAAILGFILAPFQRAQDGA